MSAIRPTTSANKRSKAPVSRSKAHRVSKTSKVLAQRNHAVVAVGAWVESGEDFADHPCALASLTDELQAEKRRENEESLRRFQDEVRQRVARVSKMKLQKTDTVVEADKRTSRQRHARTWHVSEGEKPTSASARKETHMTESTEGLREVRLRLAACRLIPHGEMMSELPGGHWNISPTRHKVESHKPMAEQEEEEEDVHGVNELLFTTRHECPLVQHNFTEYPGSSNFQHDSTGVRGRDTDRPQPDSGFESNLRVSQALWPLANQDELKRQRQSQFLMHRRLFMSREREQAKENRQHRKHLKRTARIKAEKEQIRLGEEVKLERALLFSAARQKLEERELLIQEQLKLEEEERAAELERRKRQEKGKVASRYIEALRAQMKERMSQEKLDLPPLCCCVSSFWDSHPDICANNCVFHNNPKAYAQALHSTMRTLDLQ